MYFETNGIEIDLNRIVAVDWSYTTNEEDQYCITIFAEHGYKFQVQHDDDNVKVLLKYFEDRRKAEAKKLRGE